MRVAITRPGERAEDTVKEVEEKGWEAVIVPTIEVIPRGKKEIASLVKDLQSYDWLVLTSTFGAEIMHRYFGKDLEKVKIAVIGPKTKEVLEKKGIRVEVIPRVYKAENLAEKLIEKGIKNKRILVARASIGREVLIDELKRVANVTEVPLYDTAMPRNKSGIKALEKALERGEINAIIFTSSQSAKNLFGAGDKKGLVKNLDKITVCAIGPITAQTLLEFGVKVTVMPEKYTIKACLDTLENYLGGKA